jgi:hypothetical protein
MRTTIRFLQPAAKGLPALLAVVICGGGSLCGNLNAQQPPQGVFTLSQTISDQAQRTTIAFSGLAIMTGNLDAQSFFPPGKVADYTGFQYLRDNDPDDMGHNTSFLTRAANNVIYMLNDAQFAQLKTLAVSQQDQINLYGYKRYPLMKAFRRLLDGDVPSGSDGLSLAAVKQASRELYQIDGQISFDRALLYANIIASLSSTQKAYLDAMKGKGWKSWPDIQDSQIQPRMASLPQGTAVAVMTYASDLYSWYAGSLDADIYFCPERHGTYYGGFYIKDAPAVGHEGYSINEQLTATAGAALSDSSLGYVTAAQAALMSSLVDNQRNNLYTGSPNIVQTRSDIAGLLRTLLVSTVNSDAVKTQALALSATYGELDGENNYEYATVFARIYKTLTGDQRTKMMALRKSIMSGVYADGTPFDYTVCATPFLYSSVIPDASVAPYISNTDYLFSTAAAVPVIASFTATPSTVKAGTAATLAWSVTGATSLSIDNGVGTITGATSKSVTPTVATTYTLTATNSGGSMTAKVTVTVTPAADTQAPTAPKLLTPAAKSNEVGLTWTASIDNVGVTGYRIFRNGAAIASVSGTTLAYTDRQVAANTGYTYMIKALDAAGNLSAPSNSIQVAAPAPPPPAPKGPPR